MGKDPVICLPKVRFCPFIADQKDPRYFLYLKRKGHKLKQWFTFTKNINEKHKVGEILF